VISLLACSLMGRQITVDLRPGTRLRGLHDRSPVVEQTTCNYGLDPAMQGIAEEHGMVVSGTDDTGEVRAVERPDHPFFVATLYQPQLSSTPGRPHPVFTGFVSAVARRTTAQNVSARGPGRSPGDGRARPPRPRAP
jgi:CTP synthase (UTP-ammonia lyase)